MLNQVFRYDGEKLRKLSMIDLQAYAGDTVAQKICRKDQLFFHLRFNVPVQLKPIINISDCDAGLYNICVGLKNEYTNFDSVRKAVEEGLGKVVQDIPFDRLTVLFEGIFIGNPEDVLDQRTGKSEVMYPMKGLGTKAVEVKFLEGVA